MRRGLTLIEVLVALAVASVIFSTVFLLYRTTAATALRQQERERDQYAPVAALAELQRDMASLLPRGLDEQSRLALTRNDAADGTPASDLTFCAWRPDPQSRETLWAAAEKVAWRVQQAGTPAARLVRLSAPLTGPAASAPVTNVLMTGIGRFQLQLSDGTNWLDRWPPEQPEGTEAQSAPRPRALRVNLSLLPNQGGTNWSTDFLIPNSLVVTSRLERISTTAPVTR